MAASNTLEIPSQVQLRGGPPLMQQRSQAAPTAAAAPTTGIAPPDQIGVDRLMRAIVAQESGGNPRARGKAGEIGLGQIMPALGKQYGMTPDQLADPVNNLWVMHRHLSMLYQRYDGDVSKVLTAYNAGVGNADKGHIPASTQKYISSVWRRLGNAFVGTAYADELPPSLKDAKPIDDPWGGSAAAPTPAGKATPRAMAGAAPTSDPWQAPGSPKTGAESFYERQVAPRIQRGIAAGIGGVFGGPGEMARPTETEQSIAGAMTPQSLTAAGIDVGLMATGLGEMGFLARLAIPAIGGALGAQAEGASPAAGALQGAGSSLAGEAVGAATGVVGRMALGGKVARQYTKDVGESIAGTLGKRIRVLPAKDSAMFERTFAAGGATRRAAQIAESVSTEANQAMGGGLLNFPSIGQPVHLNEAEDIIEALNEGTYTATGAAKSVQGRGAMIRQAHDMRESVATQLNRVKPGLGDKWRQSRRDLGAASALQRLFSEPGVFSAAGELNQPRVTELIRSPRYWNRLRNNLGEDDTAKLLQAARRNALGPQTDIPGREPHVRAGMTMEPHFSLPRTAKPVGDVPAVMNRAATNPARLPGGLGASAILDWFNQPPGRP